jgi:hypothetical protein
LLDLASHYAVRLKLCAEEGQPEGQRRAHDR